jgi:hypothetical protein
MLVGVISDTHDNLPIIDKAIERLNREKVSLVLHAGDYVSPFVIPRFRALNARLIGVLGNNDGDHEMLKKQFKDSANCELHGKFAIVEVENFRIALLHGNETELLNALIDCEGFDVLVHGHTHAPVVRRGKILVVNPGEVCGYLTGKPTYALLDTQNRDAKILQI